jgi:hypothetical protein
MSAARYESIAGREHSSRDVSAASAGSPAKGRMRIALRAWLTSSP